MISNQKDIQTGDVKFNHSMLIKEACRVGYNTS